MSRAPIILFAYNRPRHLGDTLDALAGARGADDSELWVFSDGPRHPEVAPKVSEVRELLATWKKLGKFRSLHVVEAASNLGLARSVIQGVSRVLEDHDRVIVLEDDLIVSVDFLDFMNDALEYYRADARVGSVTGFCPITRLPEDYRHSVALVPRNCSQGWGTWSDRWRQVDWSAAGVARLRRDRNLRRRFNRAGSDRYGRLQHQLEGRIDSWSIRFGLWQFLAGMYTVYPTQNRIRNIGYDGTGVHSGTGTPKNEEISALATPYTLEAVDEDPRISAEFYRTYSGTLPRRMLRLLKDLILELPLLHRSRASA